MYEVSVTGERSKSHRLKDGRQGTLKDVRMFFGRGNSVEDAERQARQACDDAGYKATDSVRAYQINGQDLDGA